MTDSEKEDKVSGENLFKIMDEIVHHLNKTKKMFIIMIITIMIIPPIAFVTSFMIFGPPFEWGPWHGGSSDMWQGHHYFPIIPVVPAVLFLAWIGIGIRQWFVLSKWTTKYELYKELQKKVDAKLDYDDNEEKDSEG